MYIPDKWPYPSWELDISIETDSKIDIAELLGTIESLHKNGVGYDFRCDGSAYKVALHAAKPRLIAEQIFKRVYRELLKHPHVSHISKLDLINVFAQTSY